MTTNNNLKYEFSWPDIECYWLTEENINGNVLLLNIKNNGNTLEAYDCFIENGKYCINTKNEVIQAQLCNVLTDQLLKKPQKGPDAIKWWSNLFTIKDAEIEMHEYAGELHAAEDSEMTMDQLIGILKETVNQWQLHNNEKNYNRIYVYGEYGQYLPLLYALQQTESCYSQARERNSETVTVEQMRKKCWLPKEVLSKRMEIGEGMQIEQLLNGEMTVLVPLEEKTLDSEFVGGVSWREFLGKSITQDFSMNNIPVKRIAITAYPNGWKQTFISATGCDTIIINEVGKANSLDHAEQVPNREKYSLSPDDVRQTPEEASEQTEIKANNN